MAFTFSDWLKRRLDATVSVQITLPGGEQADLIIQNWSGVKIFLHMLKEIPKLRTIRRHLQEATEIGVGTLFLVDIALLPGDGEKMAMTEWQQALHNLTGERILAYRLVDDMPEVLYIHLEQLNNGQHLTWYGPRIDFNMLRFYRTTLRMPRSIKGDWLVADFGGLAFWKNTDYRNYRATRDQHQRRERATYWKEWGYGQTWDNMSSDQAHPLRRSPLQEHLEACYKLLDVELDADKESVRAAYRKLALRYHPDTSELPNEEAVKKFHALNKAYDYIKSAKGWT